MQINIFKIINIDVQISDLTSSDRDSEHFLRKLNRARFALARTDSIRSVSSSAKPPYRRAVSVPMHLLTKTTPPKGTRNAGTDDHLLLVKCFKITTETINIVFSLCKLVTWWKDVHLNALYISGYVFIKYRPMITFFLYWNSSGLYVYYLRYTGT